MGKIHDRFKRQALNYGYGYLADNEVKRKNRKQMGNIGTSYLRKPSLYEDLPTPPPPLNPDPDPALKGVYGGNCNVTACQEPGATWWNKVMRKYYCQRCAFQINYRPLPDGTYLCRRGDGTELDSHEDGY